MALSPDPQGRRANLIREMSRGARSRASIGSDAGSDGISVKDWGTESQQLPALPAFTPERYSKSHQAEYEVNTSALRRAFPEFSQHSSSEEDSIEIGRGLGNGSRNPGRVLPSEDPSENISLNFGNGEKYTVTGTPPMKTKTTKPSVASQNSAAKVAHKTRTTSEKENQDPAVKHTSFGSRSSSGNGTVQRKQPPTVYESIEQDDSLSLPARPTQYASAKSTRFTSPPARQPLKEAKNTPNRQPPRTTANGTVDSVHTPGAGTYQSFMLPDMPNMTELVHESAKPKSRFATPRKTSNAKAKPHIEVNDVPVPADAKALYLSLQLLQEKVQNLEKERDQAVNKADNYELELLQLRSQVEGSGSDATKVEEQPQQSQQADEWTQERSSMTTSMEKLTQRLKETNRKLSTSEAKIRTMAAERSNVHDQLDRAQKTSESLRSAGAGVRSEIQALKDHQEMLLGKLERREKAVGEMATLAKQLWDTRRALVRSSSQRTASGRSAAVSGVHSGVHASNNDSGSRDHQVERLANSRPRRSNLEQSVTLDTQHTRREASVPRPIQVQHAGVTTDHGPQYLDVQDLERCETYLSFMEGDEVAKLRQVLQEDKARLNSAGGTMLPRKSSLKDVTKPSSKKAQVQYEDLSDEVCQEITGDITRPLSRASQKLRDDDPLSGEVAFEPEIAQDATQQSIRSNRQRRKSVVENGVHDDNMTSAYILPDITITGAALASTVQPKTSKADANEAHTKSKATITRPIPVSERPVSPTPSNPDPTLRPSREPGVALSLVIHSLEAEIARLREQLAKFEDLYQQTDPSLSKRRRKAVWARILKIGDAVERRADQVYALYDVLEGLKQMGIDMKEDEVEVTLAELGVDAAYMQQAMGNRSGQKVGKKAQADDDESDEDLPFETEDEGVSEVEGDAWEGFGTTGDRTGGVGAR